MKIVVAIIILLFSAAPTFASVIINEISSASSPEWLEIYNTSSISASLKEYKLNFGSDSQTKNFCDNSEILPNSYRLIILASNWLRNSDDTVTLYNGDDIVDTVSYGASSPVQEPKSSESLTRIAHDGSEWAITQTPTQQGDEISFDCPTPILSPPPSPSPNPSPTSTPTSSPASSPLPSKIPSPNPSPSIKVQAADEGTVAGQTVVDLSAFGISPTPSSSPAENNQLSVNHERAKVVIMIGLGLLILSLVALFGYRRYLESQKHAL